MMLLSGFLDSNEIYDPVLKTWTLNNIMLENRSFHTSTLLRDGSIFVAGGVTGNRTLQSAEALDPLTLSFTSLGNMQVGRNQHTDSLLPNGKVLLEDGSLDTATLQSAELFNPATNTFTPTLGVPNKARKNHTATLLPDGRVLIVGGRNQANEDLSKAEFYDPATDLFSYTGSMNPSRALH